MAWTNTGAARAQNVKIDVKSGGSVVSSETYWITQESPSGWHYQYNGAYVTPEMLAQMPEGAEGETDTYLDLLADFISQVEALYDGLDFDNGDTQTNYPTISNSPTCPVSFGLKDTNPA